jgi:hypothetical protein
LNKLLIFDSPLITVWAYPERKLIHHAMKAFCHGASFREALTKGLEAMRFHRATKWLSDDRLNGALLKEDETWAITSWLPHARAAGWKHWAIVQPEKIVGQTSMKRGSQAVINVGVETRLFADPDDAMEWLDSV